MLVPGDLTFEFLTRAVPEWSTVYLAYTFDHVLTSGAPHKVSPVRALSVFKPTIVARGYRVFLPPWVPTRLRAHAGFLLASPPNERMPTRELRVGDTFIIAFANALTGERFAVHLEAFRYTKVLTATRVFCTVRFGPESRPRNISRESGVEPGFENGDFIDSWDGKPRIFTDNTTSLQLNFVRMGDMTVDQMDLQECHVYQIDILLPMRRGVAKPTSQTSIAT